VSGAIELNGLRKVFGARVAVDQLTLTIPAGECHGLIGPNGAGKTTTFSMIAGYLRPSAGSVRVSGSDPAKPGAVKGKLGVLPQDAQLPGGTSVGVLLTYWARLSEVEAPEPSAREALERVGLLDAWPLDPLQLSHGMAKRVALAQALLGAPSVLLLDEPTAGLDPKVAALVRSTVRAAKGRHTIVISSHNLQELEELCDAATILDRGRVAQTGAMTDLTARSGEIRLHVRGDAPREALRAVRGCVEVVPEEGGWLLLRYDSRVAPGEDVTTAALAVLIASGCKISEVVRGRKLEQRVLEVT
jgi:ABC-2 type transport system ATP-binding protein